MVGRAPQAAAHLRLQLDELAGKRSAGDGGDRQELCPVASLAPGEDLEPLGFRDAEIAARRGRLAEEILECDQPGRVAVPNQHRLVTDQAGAAVAESRPQELRADARVEAHAA